MDDAVTNFDNSIGYYNMMFQIPNSPIAKYCHDAACAQMVNPNDGGASLKVCQEDPAAQVTGTNLLSYDLQQSYNTSCYPIAGTVDFTTYSSETGSPITAQRVKFSAWLYNGTVVTGPLSFYQATATPSATREVTYTDICHIVNQATGRLYGYKYCNYRDCTWQDGDFTQSVTECDPATITRKVLYTLKPGSTCLRNSPKLEPPSQVEIECTFVPKASSE